MLIGFIKRNRASSIVLLPVLLIIIWLYGFFHPVIPPSEHAAPLYELLIAGIGSYPFLLTLISFTLILCEAFLLNSIIEKNEIIDTSTYLPALVYIVLMSLQPNMFSLHPIVIANLFMLFALNKLMQTHRKETAYSEAFDTGFFISLAILFYIPSAVFILILWIGLIVIRPFIWREWVIAFIGLCIPCLCLAFYYFWNNTLESLRYDLQYYGVIASGKSFHALAFSYAEYFQLFVLALSVFFSAGNILRNLNKNTVRSRSNLLLMLYFFIFSFVSVFLAPEYSIPYLSFLSIPFSVFFSGYLLFARKEWIAEVLFSMLIISIFVNQFF